MAARDGRKRAGKRALSRDAKGRVHLDLVRDPRTGAEFVRLLSPVFEEPWQNELVAAVANTVRTFCEPQPDSRRALSLARHLMDATSTLADGLLARARASVACRAGCDHCCHQVVGVTAPEAFAIVDHVRRTWSLAEVSALATRVAEAYQRSRGLSSAQRFSPEHPCPLLHAGKCSVYEVRPLACRGVNSLSAADCATRLREPEARAAFLARGSGGQSYLEPIRAFHAMSAGLQLGLSELYRLDMRPLDLTAALQLLLSGAKASESDWLAGRTPFALAVRDEQTDDVELRRTSGALSPGR